MAIDHAPEVAVRESIGMDGRLARRPRLPHGEDRNRIRGQQPAGETA
jgi:hypothetical protein